MAIPHLHISPQSRSRGKSFAQAIAYRFGTVAVDAWTGRRHDYTARVDRNEIEATGLGAWDSLDSSWSPADPQTIATRADSAEHRVDSCIGRDVESALPHELPPDLRIECAITWANELAARYKTPVPWALHRPSQDGDQRNWHIHSLVPDRALATDGLSFGPKLGVFRPDRGGRREVHAVRDMWEQHVNTYLTLARSPERITMGRTRITPAEHLGPRLTGALRRKERRPRDAIRRLAARLALRGPARVIDRLGRQIAYRRGEGVIARAARRDPTNDLVVAATAPSAPRHIDMTPITRPTVAPRRPRVPTGTRGRPPADSIATDPAPRMSAQGPSRRRRAPARVDLGPKRTTVPVRSVPATTASSARSRQTQTDPTPATAPAPPAPQAEPTTRRRRSRAPARVDPGPKRTTVPVRSVPATTASSARSRQTQTDPTPATAPAPPAPQAEPTTRRRRRRAPARVDPGPKRTTVPVRSVPATTASSARSRQTQTDPTPATAPAPPAPQAEPTTRRRRSRAPARVDLEPKRTTVPVRSVPATTASSARSRQTQTDPTPATAPAPPAPQAEPTTRRRRNRAPARVDLRPKRTTVPGRPAPPTTTSTETSRDALPSPEPATAPIDTPQAQQTPVTAPQTPVTAPQAPPPPVSTPQAPARVLDELDPIARSVAIGHITRWTSSTAAEVQSVVPRDRVPSQAPRDGASWIVIGHYGVLTPSGRAQTIATEGAAGFGAAAEQRRAEDQRAEEQRRADVQRRAEEHRIAEEQRFAHLEAEAEAEAKAEAEAEAKAKAEAETARVADDPEVGGPKGGAKPKRKRKDQDPGR